MGKTENQNTSENLPLTGSTPGSAAQHFRNKLSPRNSSIENVRRIFPKRAIKQQRTSHWQLPAPWLIWAWAVAFSKFL